MPNRKKITLKEEVSLYNEFNEIKMSLHKHKGLTGLYIGEDLITVGDNSHVIKRVHGINRENGLHDLVEGL